MDYTELSAPAPLDQIVRCFWFLRGKLDGAPAPQTIVPDGRIEIVLHVAEPFARVDGDGAAHVQSEVVVSGQLTSPIKVIPRGATDIVGIRFRTAGTHAVIRAPLTELTDQVGDLTALSKPLASALHAAAARHETPMARMAALSEVLSKFIARDVDPVANAAVRALDSADLPRVDTVARMLGVSTRTVERKLAHHAGLAPSLLRRVIRFRRAFHALDNASAGTWSKVAIDSGFFDQAHLIRDFRQFAGAPPGEFFRTQIDLARAILSTDLRLP